MFLVKFCKTFDREYLLRSVTPEYLHRVVTMEMYNQSEVDITIFFKYLPCNFARVTDTDTNYYIKTPLMFDPIHSKDISTHTSLNSTTGLINQQHRQYQHCIQAHKIFFYIVTYVCRPTILKINFNILHIFIYRHLFP